jgi:hypothetical protein
MQGAGAKPAATFPADTAGYFVPLASVPLMLIAGNKALRPFSKSFVFRDERAKALRHGQEHKTTTTKYEDT